MLLIAFTLGRSWTTDQRRRDALRKGETVWNKTGTCNVKVSGPSGMLVRQGCVKASKSLPRRVMPPPNVRKVSNGVHRSVKRPIELHDFNALPHQQLLTLHFITTHVLAEYLKNGKAFHEFLYSQQHNASVLIATPLPSLHAIMSAIVKHGCESLMDGATFECDAIASNNSSTERTMQRVDDFGHSLLFGPSFTWELALNDNSTAPVQYLFVGIVVEPPEGYSKQSSTARAYCRGSYWSYNYCMYSGAVFSYQLLKLPLLSRFQYTLKVDTDIKMIRRTGDLASALAKQGNPHVAHTALHTETDHTCRNADRSAGTCSCHRGIHAALSSFLQSSPRAAALSSQYAWCSPDQLGRSYFYGNFVAFSTAFLLSERVQRLATYLYHHEWRGYFEYRWTDQAAYMAFVCYALDVDLKNGSSILSMHRMRQSKFVHERNDAFRTVTQHQKT